MTADATQAFLQAHQHSAGEIPPRGDSLLEEIQAIDSEARQVLGGRTQIQKIRYSHDAMIDLIIQNPWVHQNQLATHFGYSPAWVSTVMATDMFQAKLAQRREEIVDPVLKASLEERFRAVVSRSLQVLQEKLSAPANQISDSLALKAAELGAKALGIGGNAPPPPPTIPIDHLSGLAERLLQLQTRTRERIYDASPIQNLQSNQPVSDAVEVIHCGQTREGGGSLQTMCPDASSSNPPAKAEGHGVLGRGELPGFEEGRS